MNNRDKFGIRVQIWHPAKGSGALAATSEFDVITVLDRRIEGQAPPISTAPGYRLWVRFGDEPQAYRADGANLPVHLGAPQLFLVPEDKTPAEVMFGGNLAYAFNEFRNIAAYPVFIHDRIPALTAEQKLQAAGAGAMRARRR